MLLGICSLAIGQHSKSFVEILLALLGSSLGIDRSFLLFATGEYVKHIYAFSNWICTGVQTVA